MGHALHAATLHARADERIYETRAFRVRSLKGESRYLHHKQRKSNRLVRLFRICGGAEGGAARADRARDRLHARADISDKDNACRPCMLVVRQVLSSAPKNK